ncbi:hypothetical protein JANAI62_03520 [Jannaschia pagri]|uniref:DRBM domain-containing protein n=1 Tax=Jannaschia pagri TaxID=2829797 RepID=A0ABQ4NH30_9RHOB|nr:MULTISPECIES: hypothetical protein [unclassified Jannaschia]GIT90165.1 hypothetical protein JANAI61_06230 [Jannaschia sp. AI_61]GIT93729.1 hypothetical protein JANAI62_03520 [Jannaschia sp. AI_62]
MTDMPETICARYYPASGVVNARVDNNWTFAAHGCVEANYRRADLPLTREKIEAMVRPLEWLERRNNAFEAGDYSIHCNASPYDADQMWRVKFHGKVVCKQIKGSDRAMEWAAKHRTARILRALGMGDG